jgi:hypothetical protein
MAKNIVICCDGTWNTPDEEDGGVPAPTNVVRIFNATARSDGAVPQHRYYHPGVGTNGGWWDKLVGGGTGAGLDRNIMSAYRELADHYQSGDRIFLFGFSRGAYTVRSLAGMIGRCGLLDTAGMEEARAWGLVQRLFQQGYRRGTETRERNSWAGLPFHDGGNAVAIHFLGVWDTVGALGIPDDMALLNLLDNLQDHTFHDTRLGQHIVHARHAVAIDEMRATFQPTLWISPNPEHRQLWFPGVHSDVGGGYRECGLADGALKWMMEEAAALGLVFDPDMLKQVEPKPLDVLHDSWRGPFQLLPTQPRSTPRFSEKALLHDSARTRQRTPPIHQCPYREEMACERNVPATLDIFAQQPWNATGIWLDKNLEYRFEASGEWMDASIKCGPDGTDDGHFHLAEIPQLAGTVLGRVENVFKKVSGNRAADFRFTRRHENMEWFCLVGAIANGGGVDDKGHLEPHESFRIGTGCLHRPRESGYFYAYANDAWNLYGNNRGRLALKISVA